MSKEMVIQAAKQKVADARAQLSQGVQEAEAQALSDVWDQATSEAQPAGAAPSGLTQADVDAAVAAKGAEMQAALDAKQAELDAEKTLEEADQAGLAKAQSMLDGIRAVLNPPAPAAPEAPPADPAPEAPAAQ